jgi:hypothetical protein
MTAYMIRGKNILKMRFSKALQDEDNSKDTGPISMEYSNLKKIKKMFLQYHCSVRPTWYHIEWRQL